MLRLTILKIKFLSWKFFSITIFIRLGVFFFCTAVEQLHNPELLLMQILSHVVTLSFILPQVSYVSVATRETFSKVGRELLAAIATAHPDVISILLERLKETIDKVGMVRKFKLFNSSLHLTNMLFLLVVRNYTILFKN